MTGQLDPADPQSAQRFILENTRPIAPPLVPEITLRLAEELLPIWQKTEDELGELNVPPPYWAFAWAGGQAVSRYILDHPEVCRGRAVLDLGAGSGISAIAAAKAGATRVLAADIDRLALAVCAINAKVNAVTVETTDADLLAGEPPEDSLVIVGDLFYERALADRVLTVYRPGQSPGMLRLHRGSPPKLFPRRTVYLPRRISGSRNARA